MITAIIPLKKKSVRVPNKNFRPFAGTTLLDVKMRCLVGVKYIDDIVVNSESQEVLDMVTEKYPSVIPVKRDPEYATPECDNSTYFKMLAETSPAHSDILIYSPVTSPMISSSTLTGAIEKYILYRKFDSVVSVCDMKHHMWKDGEPLNYDPLHSPNSQDLPVIYKVTYGFGIIERDLMAKRRNITGFHPYFFELDEREAIDIDTELDFEFAEFVYSRNTVISS